MCIVQAPPASELPELAQIVASASHSLPAMGWFRRLRSLSSQGKAERPSGSLERSSSAHKDSLLPRESAPQLDLQLNSDGRTSPLRVPGAEIEDEARADNRKSMLTGTWVNVNKDGSEVPLKTDDATLDPAQALALLQACSTQIKSRGLDTLGIFRPHRTPESSSQVRRIVGVFLRSQPESLAPSLPSDLFGRLTTSPEELQAELNAASIHDVVSVFHWVRPKPLTS